MPTVDSATQGYLHAPNVYGEKVVRKAHARKSPREQTAECQEAAVVAMPPADLIIAPPPIWNRPLEQPQTLIKHRTETYSSGPVWHPMTPLLVPGSDLVRLSTIEEQGARFFMEHYVSEGPKPHDSNVPLFATDPRIFLFGSKMTRDARICLGLAGLANVRNDQSMMLIARSGYASVLRQVIEALQNPLEMKKDGTIGAAAMLAVFEVFIRVKIRNSRRTWAGHITGAAALLKERGLNGLERRDDVRTFVQLCFAIFIKCLQSDENVPPEILKWFNGSREHQFKCDLPAWGLASIVSRFVNLRASIKNHELAKPISIFSKMAALEADLANWVKELPAEWAFTTTDLTKDADIMFEGPYHVYRNIWVAILWNHYRSIRIMANDILLDFLDQLSSLPLDENSGISQKRRCQSVGIVSRLATDICHSIPFLLNHNGMATETKLTPTLTGVFTILWPLKVAASTSDASEALYQWARSLLQDIGRNKGIGFALFLTKVIDAQRKSRQMDTSTNRCGNNQLPEAPSMREIPVNEAVM
ncbi:hypothetical protein MMC26_003323 [Xylographa opegraphella]|nr:hypothetical protein [Xylographa opegraphella]